MLIPSTVDLGRTAHVVRRSEDGVGTWCGLSVAAAALSWSTPTGEACESCRASMESTIASRLHPAP